MTLASWRAQPRLKGQPLRVCCYAWQSSHAHSSCCQTAHPTLPLVSWASSPAQDKPFFNPFFFQQLCDFLKYQSNKTSTTHPISGSYWLPIPPEVNFRLSYNLQVQQSLVLSIASTSSSGTLSLTILQPRQPFSLCQTFFHLHISYMLSH